MNVYEKTALDDYLTCPPDKEAYSEEELEIVDYYGETIYPDDFIFVYYFHDQIVETENTLLVSYRKYVVRDENVSKLLEEKGIDKLVDSMSESYRGKDLIKLNETI